MKKFIPFVIVLSLFISDCSKKEPVVKLKKDTPAYQLAKEISVRLPFLDPDKNNALITTKDFDVTSGEVFKMIQDNFGKNTLQLKAKDADNIKEIIIQNALAIAEKRLLFNAAKDANKLATAEKVDSFMNIQMEQFGGKEKFIEGLQKNDISIDVVKEDVLSSLTINNFLEDTLANAVKVTEEDIQKVYNKDKTASVRHILLLTQGLSDSAKKAVRAKAEDLLKRAKAGENFESLAKEYSEDPGSKDNGGLYEDIEHGQMVKPFEDACFSVPVGQTSDIVETNFGYHIIKVIERKKETQPLDKVRSRLEPTIQMEKQNEAYLNFLNTLKKGVEFKVVEF